MALDLTFITEQLAVGGYCAPADFQTLQALGISRVVDVRSEDCDDAALLAEHGMTLLHLPADDRCPIPLPLLEEGVRWVVQELRRGEKVLIHCQHGVGRSALLGLCTLVAVGHPPFEALRLAKDARETVSPSPEQLGAFVAFCERRGGEVPDLRALMGIAYRHLRGQIGTGTVAAR